MVVKSFHFRGKAHAWWELGFPTVGKRWAMRAILVKRGFENAQEISYGASEQLIKCRTLIGYDLAAILNLRRIAPERKRNRCSF